LIRFSKIILFFFSLYINLFNSQKILLITQLFLRHLLVLSESWWRLNGFWNSAAIIKVLHDFRDRIHWIWVLHIKLAEMIVCFWFIQIHIIMVYIYAKLLIVFQILGVSQDDRLNWLLVISPCHIAFVEQGFCLMWIFCILISQWLSHLFFIVKQLVDNEMNVVTLNFSTITAWIQSIPLKTYSSSIVRFFMDLAHQAHILFCSLCINCIFHILINFVDYVLNLAAIFFKINLIIFLRRSYIIKFWILICDIVLLRYELSI